VIGKGLLPPPLGGVARQGNAVIGYLNGLGMLAYKPR
jgi:hypothetical protein